MNDNEISDALTIAQAKDIALQQGLAGTDREIMNILEQRGFRLALKLNEIEKANVSLKQYETVRRERDQALYGEQDMEKQRDDALSRLHQLSEDHSHCEDLKHDLGERASRAEGRLQAGIAVLEDWKRAQPEEWFAHHEHLLEVFKNGVVERREKLSAAPCSKCGYNGPGYYQPETHSCASE
jgi:hypothetical protein